MNVAVATTCTSKAKLVGRYMADQLGVEESKALDPLLIIAIASIILEIFKVLYKKNKTPKEALDTVKKPGILQRWTARRIIYNKLGTPFYDLYSKVSKGLYAQSKNLDEMSVKNILEEVKLC